MIEISCELSGPEEERIEQNGPDLPPEYCRYKDEGCELAASCLHCPFPQCLYDEPRGKQRWLKKKRDREINEMFDGGSGTRELGVLFGLSRRTIQRALKNTSGTSDEKMTEPENIDTDKRSGLSDE